MSHLGNDTSDETFERLLTAHPHVVHTSVRKDWNCLKSCLRTLA